MIIRQHRGCGGIVFCSYAPEVGVLMLICRRCETLVLPNACEPQIEPTFDEFPDESLRSYLEHLDPPSGFRH